MIALLALLLAMVTNPSNSVPYACDGATATYSVTFPYLDYTDLKVTTTTAAGVSTSLVYTTDFTVNLASTSSTATLTLNSPLSKCPVGNTLTITRSVATTQPTTFRAQTNYDQSLHERAYDRAVMQIQQLGGGLEAAGLTGASSGTITGVLIGARGGSGIASPNCLAGGQALTSNGSVQSCITMPAVAAASHAYFTNTIVNASIPATSTFTTLASLVVPAGNYLVVATAWVETNGRIGTMTLNSCRLVSVTFGGNLVANEVRVQDFGQQVNLSYTYNTPGADTITFSCRDTSGTAVNVLSVALTALSAGALN